MELAGIAPINKIINTVLHTCLLDSKYPPVSIMLVAPSGGGKSLSLLRWRAPFIHHTNDITSGGLMDILASDHEDKIRSIILPDFNIPLSHKTSVTNLTMSNLLSMMSEGTARIDDGRKTKEVKHRPISVLSAVTPDMFVSQHRKWRILGIIRRFVAIQFTYSIATERKGMELIRDDKLTGSKLPEFTVETKIRDANPVIQEKESFEIENLAISFAAQLGCKVVRDYKTGKVHWQKTDALLAFSPHVTLKTLARANAISEGRAKINRNDIEFLTLMLGFTDPSKPGVI